MSSRRAIHRLLAAVVAFGTLAMLAVLAQGSSAMAQEKAPTGAPTAEPTFRFAVWAVPPFIEKSPQGKFSGFSIDLLDDLADEGGFNIDYVEVDSVAAQLDAVRDGRADAAISAISITSGREETIDFSSSMFESGIQVMVSNSAGGISFSGILAEIFTPILLILFGLIVAGTLLAGTFVWALERNHGNEHFTNRGAHGVFDGIWWATVTLFTIGYGDMVPRRVLTRLVTMVWIFFGVLMVAAITAQVTASLTVEQLESRITSVSELAGRDVITYPGTTSWDYLRTNGLDPRPVEDIDLAYEEVRSGAADAFVFDASIIQWLVANRGGVQAAGPVIQPENYGIAMPEGSPLKETIDRSLLRLREDGTYERLKKSYFG